MDEAALRNLGDELAIRDLVARYSDAVNRRDETAWAATWAEDGRWYLGAQASEGREKIVTTWRTLMGLFEFVAQLPAHGIIEVDGDEATGRWTIQEIGRPKGGPGSSTIALYDDLYRRDAGDWRIVERRFQVLYTGPPDLSGQVFPYPG
jgi:uncharacterized protein (TIGR02246 family)